MKKVAIAFVLIFGLSAFNCRNKQAGSGNPESVNYLKIGDSLIKTGIKDSNIVTYVKTKGQFKKVEHSAWPDDVDETYNLISNNIVKVYIQIPYSESGDWNNEYTYYYDKENNLRVLKMYSGFFNNMCSDIAKETKIIYYNKKHDVDSSSYTLVDENGKPIKDTSKCQFPYRDKEILYVSYKDVPLIKAIAK